jgi:hypothetical protein
MRFLGWGEEGEQRRSTVRQRHSITRDDASCNSSVGTIHDEVVAAGAVPVSAHFHCAGGFAPLSSSSAAFGVSDVEYCLGEESGYLNLPSSMSSAHPGLVVVRCLHDSYGNLVVERYRLDLRTVKFPAISVKRRTEI